MSAIHCGSVWQVNWMIDRNLTVSYLIVDEMHQEHPELLKDQYWNEVFPNELPYIDESQRTAPPKHSTAKLVPSKQNPDVSKNQFVWSLIFTTCYILNPIR